MITCLKTIQIYIYQLKLHGKLKLAKISTYSTDGSYMLYIVTPAGLNVMNLCIEMRRYGVDMKCLRKESFFLC